MFKILSNHQDRRGFYGFFVLSAIITALSVVGFLRSPIDGDIWKRLYVAFAITGVCGFITAEGLSRPPRNSLRECVKLDIERGKRDEDEKVLVCLGDSLTHGACSSDWVSTIVPQLNAQQQNNHKKKLRVINAGQNSICTHTILHERVEQVLACRPDFLFVMIGTNDIMAMYRKDWANDKKRLWNLPETPTEEIIMSNLTAIVTRLLDETNTKIALATLPPMGEDANHTANHLVQKINQGIQKLSEVIRTNDRLSIIDINSALLEKINRSSSNRSYFHSVDNFLPYSILFGMFHCVLGVKWEPLSRVFTGNVVLSESLHLNEVGGDIIRDKVVDWLVGCMN